MEMKVDVTFLIMECAQELGACYICGEHAKIEHEYDIACVRVPGKKHPHKFCIKCTAQNMACSNVGTDKVYAEDDEVDLKEAIRMLVLLWNSLPNKPDDAAIQEMYKGTWHYFKNQEEARDYYETIGVSYDKNNIHIAVLV